jgi:hypothetical protein
MCCSCVIQAAAKPQGTAQGRIIYRPNGYTPAPNALFDLTEFFPGLLEEFNLLTPNRRALTSSDAEPQGTPQR